MKNKVLIIIVLLLLFSCEKNKKNEIHTLGVGSTIQQTQVWCWAACTQMVLGFYNYYYSQEEIVTNVFGAPIVTAANDIQLMSGLNNLGNMNSQVIYLALTFDNVKSYINNGMPLIPGYSGSFMGHVVVLYGYDSKGNVYIHDPYYGSFVVPYASSFSYNGNLYWNKTFYNLKPVNLPESRLLEDVFEENSKDKKILNVESVLTSDELK